MALKPMFAGVAKRYDLLNRILTLGLDEVWRKICAKECATGTILVDLCCGTGDLALHISKGVASKAYVLGIDFSKVMLKKASYKKFRERQKIEQTNIKQNNVGVNIKDIRFILADAAHLPLRNESIDRIGISFSFRNLVYTNTNVKMYLKEILRTLRLGGKFVCIETSQPRGYVLRFLYHIYLRRVVPLIGWLISRRKGAYRYLGISATNFPTAEEIAKMLFGAGFRDVSFKHMILGIVALHIGVK